MKNLGNLLFFIAVFAQACMPRIVSAASDTCEDFTAVTVSGKAVLISDIDYLKTRTGLVDSLLVEAASRVNGAKIRSRETSRQLQTNSELEDTFTLDTVRTMKAMVKSYSFPTDGEQIVVDPDLGRMLSLNMEVIVCDQSNIDALYISLGDFTFSGFEDFNEQLVVPFLKSAIPNRSSLRLVDNESDVAYYDFVVSGKVLNLAVTAENSAAKALLANAIKVNGNSIVDPIRYRLSATVALKVENPVDKSYMAITQVVERKHSSSVRRDGALQQRIDEFVGEAVGEVAAVLFQRIDEGETFKRPFSR